MARKSGIEIFTVFGQIEAIAADFMIKKYGLTKIETRDFPPTVDLENSDGTYARFAVIFPRAHMSEFDHLVSDMLA